MVNQIATTSRDMCQQVSANQVAAAATRRRVIQTVEDIGQAHQRLNHVNTEMQAVATTNRRLSGIVKLMMDIARQTNILAVNANIEASRGGTSGGGFGVIAEQVRNPAARTTQASGEIDELLSNSVAKVESSVKDIESIAGTVETASTSSQLGNLADGLRHFLATLSPRWPRLGLQSYGDPHEGRGNREPGRRRILRLGQVH